MMELDDQFIKMKKASAFLILISFCIFFSGFNLRHEEKPEFIYVCDPLCGWCYGFSPVIKQIKKKYKDQATFSIYSGGLATGDNVMPIGEIYKDMEGAFEGLELTTGVEFGEPFFNMIDDGSYRYNSEPPAIALCIVKEMKPEIAYDFLSRLQTALFVEGKNLNDTVTYSELSEEFGLDRKDFIQKFQDTVYLNKARAEFDLVAENGISGFPFLFLKKDGEVHIIADGYVDFKKADRKIRKVLE